MGPNVTWSPGLIGHAPGMTHREVNGSEVRVRRVNDDPEHRADRIRALRGIWAESGGGTKELLEERRRERDAEERKAPG